MRRISRKGRVFVAAAMLVVPALVVGCDDDAVGPQADASTSSEAGDAGGGDASVASDTSTPSDAADAADAAPSASLDNGTYNATVWTCTGASGTIDVKAYAASIGIDEVHFTVNGAAGQTDALYGGAPACTRTIQFTLAYPSAGTYSTTGAAAYTCSATCPAAKCTAGAQPVIVDTFAFTKAATSFSATRTLGTPLGLQLAAACQAGGNESITWTKL